MGASSDEPILPFLPLSATSLRALPDFHVALPSRRPTEESRSSKSLHPFVLPPVSSKYVEICTRPHHRYSRQTRAALVLLYATIIWVELEGLPMIYSRNTLRAILPIGMPRLVD